MYGITGANGQLGRLVINNLLAMVPANQIIAVTRHPARLEEFAVQGVQLREGDFNEPALLPVAFMGVKRLLIISTDDLTGGNRSEQHGQAIRAAKEAGVEHLFYTSAVNPDPDSENPLKRDHGLTENHLKESGLKWTALRNNIYGDGLAGMLQPSLSNGKFFIPQGEGKTGYVAREDCARVAALILAGKPDLSGPVDITGPEALSYRDLGQRISEVLGKSIEVEALSNAELQAHYISNGLPPEAAGGLVWINSMLAQGGFEVVSDTVKKVTGIDPTPVDVFLEPLKA
ncbi:MAG: hypothetical protein JWP00_3769 [Chloroflexi bacterium]|jgi:NAD(P)H dehydrogenase (quinone)|nr:hypothetical protein [Chloroflexota bacterium]